MKYLFPKKVSIFNDEHQLIHFGPGIVKVDEQFEGHWFFTANGATPLDEDGNPVESEEEESTEGEEDAPTSRRKKRR